MLIKGIALLVMIFSLSLAAPVWAAETGSGKIEGRLVNGTKDGSSVTDQVITLKTYLSDVEKSSATTKTDAVGQFVFAGLVTDSGYSYDVTVTFQEADYTGERLSFKAGELSKSIELTVYDSTTSDEAVKVTAAHTIIYVGQGSLQIIEVFAFSNESDRTYIGSGEITATGKRRTLRLPPLPAKMTELQYYGELMEHCVVPEKESFWDTMPVLPGSKDIAYSYQISYSGGEYTFSRRVNYPMSGFNLLVPSESVAVTSDQLVQGETIEIQGSRFTLFSGEDFAPGNTLLAQLSGLPQVASRGVMLWVALTLLVLTAGFGLVYLRRKGQLPPVRAEDSLEQRRQRLLAELAQMDDDFEDGKIAERDYRRWRAEKKAQLVTLLSRPKGSRGKR